MNRLVSIFINLLTFVLSLGLAAPAPADLLSQQPSYTRMAASCGEDTSRPSYSNSDYAAAMKEATAAIKEARREGNRARLEAIQQSVTRLKECQLEEERKFTLPPISNCADFVAAFKAFSARAESLLRSGKITAADRDRVREHFRAPAESCVRNLMTNCIDPTKASVVDATIEAMDTASVFGFVYTSVRQTGFDRFLTVTNPFFLRMRFCTDTDYACKGDKAACDRRVERLKAIMETYIKR